MPIHEDMTEPAATTPARGRGRLLVAGAAAAAVVLGGGGAFAFSMLSGGGPQPADVMPSTMQAYARIDLDPSAGQKIALFKLVRKIPDAAKELDKAEDIDLRRVAFEDLLGGMCDDLDYDKDVEPWLGQRIGVGANVEDEQILVAAQITDEAKARSGIDTIADCGGQEIGLAFVDGYALLSDSQKSVDDAIDANAKGTLGDDKDFTADMDALGEQGVASAWFDGDALGGAVVDSGMLPGDAADLDQLRDLGNGAVAIRAAGSAIEVAAISDASKAPELEPAPIGDLPADTVVALSASGLGPQVSKQFDSFRDAIEQGLGDFTSPGLVTDPESDDPFADEFSDDFFQDSQVPGPSIDDMLDGFEDETGLRLPDDLATLLGTTFTLAVGQANLATIPQMGGPDDLEKLDVAIRTQGDASEVKKVMDTLVALAADNGLSLFAEGTDDGAVLATNEDAATSLLDGGKLSDDEGFKDVMPYGDDTLQGLFIDTSALIETIREADPPPEVLEGLTQVEAISGAGFSIGQIDADWLGFSFRVAFDD